ncbi:hypothetical protein BT96DRAFT_936962 [Gymnopus androsaceus JB14]|uniref:Uncharacterized protein n=1 Tax=Gymnopus androsaceus JB14 TaxID=1447944 RepID=A0A6A4I1M2_9AGAR|nr:hypothetical protein BT96DRAFT_936962 [Gymnopus androsaceus JB14]
MGSSSCREADDKEVSEVLGPEATGAWGGTELKEEMTRLGLSVRDGEGAKASLTLGADGDRIRRARTLGCGKGTSSTIRVSRGPDTNTELLIDTVAEFGIGDEFSGVCNEGVENRSLRLYEPGHSHGKSILRDNFSGKDGLCPTDIDLFLPDNLRGKVATSWSRGLNSVDLKDESSTTGFAAAEFKEASFLGSAGESRGRT